MTEERPAKNEAKRKIAEIFNSDSSSEESEASYATPDYLSETLITESQDILNLSKEVEKLKLSQPTESQDILNLSKEAEKLKLNQPTEMADIKVTDLLRDIKEFSGELKDINKFISSCKAAFAFIPDNEANANNRSRFLNGIKNK